MITFLNPKLIAMPNLDALNNCFAMTSTPLRPTGYIRIDGQLYDAIAELSFISCEQKVKVIGRLVNMLIVIAVEIDSG